MSACREIRALLMGHLQDELTPLERTLADAHLAHCAACRAVRADLAAGLEAARREPDVDIARLIALVESAEPTDEYDIDTPDLGHIASPGPSPNTAPGAANDVVKNALARAARARNATTRTRRPRAALIAAAAIVATSAAAAAIVVVAVPALMPGEAGDAPRPDCPTVAVAPAGDAGARPVDDVALAALTHNDALASAGSGALASAGSGERAALVDARRGALTDAKATATYAGATYAGATYAGATYAGATGDRGTTTSMPASMSGSMPGSMPASNSAALATKPRALPATARTPASLSLALQSAHVDVAALPPAESVDGGATLDELLPLLDQAARLGRSGDGAEALTRYRALEQSGRFAKHKALIEYDRARLEGLVLGDVDDALVELQVLAEGKGHIAAEARLTRCEVLRKRNPCAAVSCLDAIEGDMAADAGRLRARWGENCASP